MLLESEMISLDANTFATSTNEDVLLRHSCVWPNVATFVPLPLNFVLPHITVKVIKNDTMVAG